MKAKNLPMEEKKSVAGGRKKKNMEAFDVYMEAGGSN